MKKILSVFTTGFVSWGGLTTVMMNYYRNIEESEILIDFASTNVPDKNLCDEIEKRGSRYYKLPSRRKYLPLYFIKLKNICKGYDIIHVHGNSATSVIELYAAKMAGVNKRYIHNHNSETDYPLINRLLKPFFMRSYSQAFACSSLAGNWLFGEGNYSLLRNAIDIEKYLYRFDIQNEIRKNLGIDENEFVIGHIGKFVAAKNHFFLIDIFKRILIKTPKSRLLLIGDGILKNEIVEYVNNNGIEKKVIMTGIRTDIPILVQAMDIFLFPSIHEGLPLSVLEAQASGLPCFLSDAITKEVGIGIDVFYIQKERTAQEWADYIGSCDIRMKREERCKKNHQQITQAGYNIKVEANELLKIYNS